MKDKRILWIILGLVAILIKMSLSNSPEFVENFYSRGVFIPLRQALTFLFSWIPVPAIYVQIMLLAGWLIYRLIKYPWRRNSWKKRIIDFLLTVGAVLGGAVFFFLLLWGYNYQRIPVEKQMGLELAAQNEDRLFQEWEEVLDTLVQIRRGLNLGDWDSREMYEMRMPARDEVREEVKEMLRELGYPSDYYVKARFLKPKGIILRIGTSGFYWPFSGECNMDDGLHPLQIPSVLAHEYAHGYGFGDEGTCNFLAYLTCSVSGNDFTRYSGLLSYWRYVARECRMINPKKFNTYYYDLPEEIISDLEAIRKQMDKYPDFMPRLRDLTYETYLKSQGVHEGLASYNRVVLLVTAYKKKMFTLEE